MVIWLYRFMGFGAKSGRGWTLRVDNIKTALKQYDYQSTCGAKNMFKSTNGGRTG